MLRLISPPSSSLRVIRIGAQIVGPEADKLIHELIAVMSYHGTSQDLLRMPHDRPTLAEILTHPAAAIVKSLPGDHAIP